jgi:endogenous inhibitor of DNA gyrase (YacG/DUF329 family)
MASFPCPTCQKPVEWSAQSAWRPFCSERCRLIDLGAWINEQRSIPDEGEPGENERGDDRARRDRDDTPRH